MAAKLYAKIPDEKRVKSQKTEVVSAWEGFFYSTVSMSKLLLKKFIIVILDINSKTLVVYIAIKKQEEMVIDFIKKAQIKE